MRPIFAIVPLALLLAWFSPAPSSESGPSGPLGMNGAQSADSSKPSATEQLAEAWQSIQRGGFLQATSEVPQRR